MSAEKEFYNYMLSQLLIKKENFDFEEDQDILNVVNLPQGKLKLKAIIEAIVQEANRQLSYYRQRKEDLIARMATDWPKWGCGLDFYIFFIQPLLMNPLLLHFINLSDGFALSNIRVKYGYAEPSGHILWAIPKLKIAHPPSDEKCINADSVEFAISSLREIKISNGKSLNFTILTDGLKSSLVRVRDADIGVQAFFSIFEGIVRNAAKHRMSENKESILEMRIVFCENIESLNELYNQENVNLSIDEKGRAAYILLSASLDYLKDKNNKDRIVKEGENFKPLIDFINEHLNSPIINESGNITPMNWGLKEMKICAAFLSGAPLESVNSKEQNFIQVTKSPKALWDDGKERLTYILKVEKPRYVLAIVPEKKKPVNAYEYEKNGIKVIRVNELEKEDLDYDFLYLSKEVSLPNRINDSLPQRQVEDSLDLSSPQTFLYKVYDAHLKKIFGKNKKYKVCIYFEDDQKAQAWESWWNSYNDKPAYMELITPCNSDFGKVIGMLQNDTETSKILILRHTGIGGLENFSRSEIGPDPFCPEGEELQSPKRRKIQSQVCYQEFATYSDLFFSFLYSIEPSSLAPLVLRQLVESAVLNVLVIDERIAQVLTTAEVADASGKVKLEEKLYWMGIYVAKCVKVGKDVFNYIGNGKSERMVDINLDDILNNKSSFEIEKGFPIHMLLIHLTKLKDIAKQRGIAKSTDLIKELKKVIPYVIVHSGRGKTEGDVPENAPFLEYSILQRYLLQEPSKFYLVQIALSSRGGA